MVSALVYFGKGGEVCPRCRNWFFSSLEIWSVKEDVLYGVAITFQLHLNTLKFCAIYLN